MSDEAPIPAEISGHLGTRRAIFSSQIAGAVEGRLEEQRKLIRELAGRQLRVPMAMPDDIDAALRELVAENPVIAGYLQGRAVDRSRDVSTVMRERQAEQAAAQRANLGFKGDEP